MTDPLPDWFKKLFAERQDVALDRFAQAKTTEDLWDSKGRIAAFLDIKNEIEMYEASVTAAELERQKELLTPHA